MHFYPPHGAAGISVMMMELGEFSTTAVKLKAINFCAIHLIKEEKKENGELVLFYSSYYREKWEEGAIERAEHVENMAASIKHLITFRPKKNNREIECS